MKVVEKFRVSNSEAQNRRIIGNSQQEGARVGLHFKNWGKCLFHQILLIEFAKHPILWIWSRNIRFYGHRGPMHSVGVRFLTITTNLPVFQSHRINNSIIALGVRNQAMPFILCRVFWVFRFQKPSSTWPVRPESPLKKQRLNMMREKAKKTQLLNATKLPLSSIAIL